MRVSATSSLSMRIGLAHKKGFGSHDGATPHHSFTFEDVLPDDATVEEKRAAARACWDEARALCEEKIKEDKEDLLKST